MTALEAAVLFLGSAVAIGLWAALALGVGMFAVEAIAIALSALRGWRR